MNTNRERILAFQQAVEDRLQGQAIDLAPFFTEDAIWHLPRSAADWGSRDRIGRDAVLRMFAEEVTQFYRPDSMRFHYHAVTAEADRVHLHFTLHAVTANGNDYENEYQTLFRLRDGCIAEAWEYLDTAYLFKQLGLNA